MADTPEPATSDPSTDSVTLRIDAAPERIYGIVSDITQMGRLSPECTGGRWLGGAAGPGVGVRFRGHNKRGIVRWSTTSTVVAADPGRTFAFETRESGMRWSYDLAADGTGTVVTESRARYKPRAKIAGFFAAIALGGIEHHDDEIFEGMRATLDRVKAIAES